MYIWESKKNQPNMKKQLLLLILILLGITNHSFSQAVCGGTFTDPAGATVNYANSTDNTVTICPTIPGQIVTVTFTSFNTEATWDGLYVFDGNALTSPQIASTNPAGNVPGGLAGSYWGTTIPGPFTSTDPSGCLTFRFVSDSQVNRPGWVANVTCAPPPTCPKPTSLIASGITTNSAVLGWTNNSSATSWEVLVLPCGSNPLVTSTGVVTSANPYTITGLSYGTCYSAFVRAICSPTDKSDWSIASTITTTIPQFTCNNVFTDPAGLTLNYLDNTDSTVTICSTIPGGIVTATFTSFDTETNYDGLYVFNGNSISSPQIASTNTAMNVPGGLAGGYWGTTIPGPFSSTDPSGCLTFRFRSDTTVTRAGWNANITCNPPPTCLKPTNLVTAFGTTNAVTLGWTNNSSATSWEVLALPCGSPIPTSTSVGTIVSTNPYTITGLNQNTCYNFYVRAICSTTDISFWSIATTYTTLATCPKPTALLATSITATSLVLGWTEAGSATSWEVIALPCGSPVPTATITGVITTVNPYVLTGLNPLTCYNLYVKAVCSPTDSSLWSTPITATTLYAPPVCGGIFADLQGIAANYANSSDSTVTICSAVVGEIVTVTFTSFNTEVNWDALYVFDGDSIASTQIASTNPAANVPGGLAGGYWGTTIPGPFTSTDATGCLTFRFRSDNTINNPGWIANVSCSPPPTCPKPSALITSAGTINSVTLGWTNNSSATSWEILMLPCGSPAPTATSTGIITSSNPYTITGLTDGTCYDIYVRAICSASDISLWSVKTSFTTLLIPPVCGGNYTDTGGTGNYFANSDSTVTICPSTPGESVTVTFSAFNTEANADALYVFDGDSISSPQIASANAGGTVPGGITGGYWGTVIPGPFTSTDPSGCLTFRFRSNATINNAGWAATISCAPDSDKILLVAFVDQNSNGTKEANESLYSNGSFVYQQNNVGNFINAYSPTGRYPIYDAVPTNTYDFSYEVQTEYLPYYNSGTITFNDISIPTGSGTQILYFPITLTTTYNDVAVSIVPINGPRPGLTYINKIEYRNLGIAATSGTLTFVKPSPVAIINVSQTGTVANTNGFTYTYTNLLPNEVRYINVTMTVPSLPTVAINQLLTATASSTVPTDDINSVNNSTTNSQIILAAYDPNDKMESRGDKIPINTFTIDDYFYYTIRFQNNGTANAIDVNIEDVLNVKIDEATIRMISASHNYTMTRVNNSIDWNFKNIQLVPESISPELSKGFVHFKVKLKPGFTVGTIVPNNASIVFDSNPAIVTNTFNTKFVSALSNPSYEFGDFIMYPNPANSSVQISMKNVDDTIETISITDILGKTIKTISTVTSNEITLDVSNFANGVYFVELTTANHLKQVKKLVIE